MKAMKVCKATFYIHPSLEEEFSYAIQDVFINLSIKSLKISGKESILHELILSEIGDR